MSASKRLKPSQKRSKTKSLPCHPGKPFLNKVRLLRSILPNIPFVLSRFGVQATARNAATSVLDCQTGGTPVIAVEQPEYYRVEVLLGWFRQWTEVLLAGCGSGSVSGNRVRTLIGTRRRASGCSRLCLWLTGLHWELETSCEVDRCEPTALHAPCFMTKVSVKTTDSARGWPL